MALNHREDDKKSTGIMTRKVGTKLNLKLYFRPWLWPRFIAEPEFQGGKNGVNKFISDSYGYGGYRETEMARDQWKDLSYDKNHGQGASKYRKSAYDNWDQDFEQKYKWEDFASKWAIKRKEKNFYNK